MRRCLVGILISIAAVHLQCASGSDCHVPSPDTRRVLGIHAAEARKDFERGKVERALVLLRSVMELSPKHAAGFEVIHDLTLAHADHWEAVALAADWCERVLSPKSRAAGDCSEEDPAQSGDTCARLCGSLAQSLAAGDGPLDTLHAGHKSLAASARLAGAVASDPRSTWAARLLEAALLFDSGNHGRARAAFASVVPRPGFPGFSRARLVVASGLLAGMDAEMTGTAEQPDHGTADRTHAVFAAVAQAAEHYADDRAPFFGANERGHDDQVAAWKLRWDARRIRALVARGLLDPVGDGGAWDAHAEALETVAASLHGGGPGAVTPLEDLDTDTQVKPIEDILNRAVYTPEDPVSESADRAALPAELASLLTSWSPSSPVSSTVPAVPERVLSRLRSFLDTATVWNEITGVGVARAMLADGFHPSVVAELGAAVIKAVAAVPEGAHISLADAWAEAVMPAAAILEEESSDGPVLVDIPPCSSLAMCAGTEVLLRIVLPLHAPVVVADGRAGDGDPGAEKTRPGSTVSSGEAVLIAGSSAAHASIKRPVGGDTAWNGFVTLAFGIPKRIDWVAAGMLRLTAPEIPSADTEAGDASAPSSSADGSGIDINGIGPDIVIADSDGSDDHLGGDGAAEKSEL